MSVRRRQPGYARGGCAGASGLLSARASSDFSGATIRSGAVRGSAAVRGRRAERRCAAAPSAAPPPPLSASCRLRRPVSTSWRGKEPPSAGSAHPSPRAGEPVACTGTTFVSTPAASAAACSGELVAWVRTIGSGRVGGSTGGVWPGPRPGRRSRRMQPAEPDRGVGGALHRRRGAGRRRPAPRTRRSRSPPARSSPGAAGRSPATTGSVNFPASEGSNGSARSRTDPAAPSAGATAGPGHRQEGLDHRLRGGDDRRSRRSPAVPRFRHRSRASGRVRRPCRRGLRPGSRPWRHRTRARRSTTAVTAGGRRGTGRRPLASPR